MKEEIRTTEGLLAWAEKHGKPYVSSPWDFEAWKNSYPTEEQIKKYKEAMGKICMYCKKTIRIEDFMDGKASDRWQPDTAYAPERTDYYHVACDNEAATDTLGKLK